jgi:hypothetical protein
MVADTKEQENEDTKQLGGTPRPPAEKDCPPEVPSEKSDDYELLPVSEGSPAVEIIPEPEAEIEEIDAFVSAEPETESLPSTPIVPEETGAAPIILDEEDLEEVDSAELEDAGLLDDISEVEEHVEELETMDDDDKELDDKIQDVIAINDGDAEVVEEIEEYTPIETDLHMSVPPTAPVEEEEEEEEITPIVDFEPEVDPAMYVKGAAQTGFLLKNYLDYVEGMDAEWSQFDDCVQCYYDFENYNFALEAK